MLLNWISNRADGINKQGTTSTARDFTLTTLKVVRVKVVLFFRFSHFDHLPDYSDSDYLYIDSFPPIYSLDN